MRLKSFGDIVLADAVHCALTPLPEEAVNLALPALASFSTAAAIEPLLVVSPEIEAQLKPIKRW